MANNEMTEAKVAELYAQGFNCSQVVLCHAAEELGMDLKTARRIAAGFGGGIYRGEVCGSVSGAVMALGLAFGHDTPFDGETSAEMVEKMKEFTERFTKGHGSVVCRELLGYDFRDPEQAQKARESGIMKKVCPSLITGACRILDDML